MAQPAARLVVEPQHLAEHEAHVAGLLDIVGEHGAAGSSRVGQREGGCGHDVAGLHPLPHEPSVDRAVARVAVGEDHQRIRAVHPVGRRVAVVAMSRRTLRRVPDLGRQGATRELGLAVVGPRDATRVDERVRARADREGSVGHARVAGGGGQGEHSGQREQCRGASAQLDHRAEPSERRHRNVVAARPPHVVGPCDPLTPFAARVNHISR